MCEITKEILISAFKNCCVSTDIKTFLRRKLAVTSQYNRNVWEVYDPLFGLLRIRGESDDFEIRIFLHSRNYFEVTETFFPLTQPEYNELKTLYFGSFKEDPKYFNKINSLYNETN